MEKTILKSFINIAGVRKEIKCEQQSVVLLNLFQEQELENKTKCPIKENDRLEWKLINNTLRLEQKHNQVIWQYIRRSDEYKKLYDLNKNNLELPTLVREKYNLLEIEYFENERLELRNYQIQNLNPDNLILKGFCFSYGFDPKHARYFKAISDNSDDSGELLNPSVDDIDYLKQNFHILLLPKNITTDALDTIVIEIKKRMLLLENSRSNNSMLTRNLLLCYFIKELSEGEEQYSKVEILNKAYQYLRLTHNETKNHSSRVNEKVRAFDNISKEPLTNLIWGIHRNKK